MKFNFPEPAKCPHCGTRIEYTEGWVPSYSDPDNYGLGPQAEPYCPKCDEPGITVSKDLIKPPEEQLKGLLRTPNVFQEMWDEMAEEDNKEPTA